MQTTENKTDNQAGFTLFELMIAIAVIAILTSIGIPAYQGYIQKAALTDMLQTMPPYKNSVELCVLEQGKLAGCSNGNKGIPASRSSNYVASVSVTNGVIILTGSNTLQGLTTTITPTMNNTDNQLIWSRTCSSSPDNASLEQACQDIFRF